MKKNIFLIIGLFAMLTQPATAQNPYKGKISVDVLDYVIQNKKVIVNADVILDELTLAGNSMITITPVLRSLDRMHEMGFEPLIINGGTRNKVNLRATAFGDYSYPQNTAGIIKRENEKAQQFSYLLETAYQPWMRNSELIFVESVSGCNCSDKGNTTYPGGKMELSPPYIPNFQLTYLVPAVEAVKLLSDSYSASLDYAVNKSDVDYSFKNNAAVLEAVDRIISEVKNDPNIVIDKIEVVGYASPDGGTAYNTSLSEKRAKSFTNYLISRHGISEELITTNWKGEDWVKLSTILKESDYPYRNDVLQVIDNTNDINKRKATLKSLQGGMVYNNLLKTYFPLLRRNSYDIFYTVRGLDLEQSKALINVKPQQLSLNEMFMVANSYKEGSEQFKKAFAIAVTVYPDDPMARFNSLTSQIDSGFFEDAVTGLQQTDRPEGWNNIAVALFYMGDYQRALSFFEKAAHAGLKEAVDNLAQYKQWLNTKDN